MRKVFPFALMLVCCVPLIAQHIVPASWSDKNNTQMSAAHMLKLAYYERGYMDAHVLVTRTKARDVYRVNSGPVYHFKDVKVAGLVGDNLNTAMENAPKSGDVYSAARVNEWIKDVEGRLGKLGQPKRGHQSQDFHRATASVNVSVQFE